MSFLQQFQQFITRENLFTPKDKLLLAVSGGLDSVVLCELCQQAGYDFVVAHCNFQLRGAESERDEQFVRSLGEKYGKPILVKHFETEQYAAANKLSIQVAARELRYEWFFSIVNGEWSMVNSESLMPTGHSPLPTRLLTAHHLGDNIETLLMNFFKGTGITGLRAMLPKQDKLARPLLFAKKEALQQFAEENKLGWVEDSSNASDKYTRNYLRHQFIPLLQNIYPEVENNLGASLERFREIEELYNQSIHLHKKKLLEYKGNEVHIPVLKLKKAEPLVSIVYEIIKDYHFTSSQADEVVHLLDAATGRYVQSSTHRIFKNRHWLIISPLQTSEAFNILIEKNDTEIVFDGGVLKINVDAVQDHKESIGVSGNEASLDAADISFPLLLRKWKQGDYFYPLGMKKKKKLSRFFIDQKLSKTEKERVWILEMDKKIIWVIGYRIDNRFKITPSTKQVLHIKSEFLNV